MPTRDYYSVLGVPSTATAEEIKKQYRRLAKQYHPDSNQGDATASERFKEISEAHSVLGDATKRTQYDEMRRLGAYEQAASPRGGARAGGGAAGGSSFRFEDFDVGGLGGLGDLFGTMFGNRGGNARARGPEPGPSVETTLEVPFRTAATGGKLPIDLEVSEGCAACSGSGAAPGARTQACQECGGRGTISFGQGSFSVNRPCPACLGRGTTPSVPCPACQGAGEVRTRKKVMITVPAGTETGAKVRLKGQGGRGRNGGPSGDLLITFTVAADTFYRRDGLDLIATIPLNIAQATLGSKVSVRSLSGSKVSLRIPAGTPSGKRFRVRGQGITREGATGDLLVEVQIVAPESLTDEQRALMEQFAAAADLSY
jgi:molecular chaperone DnaJ